MKVKILHKRFRTDKCIWETKMKFWIFTFYKYSIFKNGKQKSYYRFFNYKNQKSVYIKKSTKTVIYHDADELLKKYGNKWQIPTNKDWVFFEK